MNNTQNPGVLAQVLGEELAAAARHLPPASQGGPEMLHAETDTVHHGRVRITFRLALNKRGKMRYWFWSATHAERVPGSE